MPEARPNPLHPRPEAGPASLQPTPESAWNSPAVPGPIGFRQQRRQPTRTRVNPPLPCRRPCPTSEVTVVQVTRHWSSRGQPAGGLTHEISDRMTFKLKRPRLSGSRRLTPDAQGRRATLVFGSSGDPPQMSATHPQPSSGRQGDPTQLSATHPQPLQVVRRPALRCRRPISADQDAPQAQLVGATPSGWISTGWFTGRPPGPGVREILRAISSARCSVATSTTQ